MEASTLDWFFNWAAIAALTALTTLAGYIIGRSREMRAATIAAKNLRHTRRH